MTEVAAQHDTVIFEKKKQKKKSTPPFQLYLCLRFTSPNYAFMRRRLCSKRKVK